MMPITVIGTGPVSNSNAIVRETGTHIKPVTNAPTRGRAKLLTNDVLRDEKPEGYKNRETTRFLLPDDTP